MFYCSHGFTIMLFILRKKTITSLKVPWVGPWVIVSPSQRSSRIYLLLFYKSHFCSSFILCIIYVFCTHQEIIFIFIWITVCILTLSLSSFVFSVESVSRFFSFISFIVFVFLDLSILISGSFSFLSVSTVWFTPFSFVLKLEVFFYA